MNKAPSDPFPYRFSGIGRPIDPSYPTNLAVLFLAVVGFVGGTVLDLFADAGWLHAGLSGVSAALTVFLAWALTRELAPDDDPAAFISIGLVGAAWFLLGRQSLLIPVVLLMAVRVVNRSTGKAAELTDALLVLPLFGFAAWFASWTLGIVGAASLALDAVLPRASGQPRRRYHLGLSVLLLGVVALRLLVETPGIRVPGPPLLLLALLATAAGLVYPSPRSRGDVDGALLVHARVRSALLLGVLATVSVTLDAGVPAGSLALPWCSVAAVVVGLPFVVARRRVMPA